MSSDPETCDEPELSVEGEEIVCETLMYIKSDDEDDDDTQSETHSMEGQRPVRPVERQKMRPWLIELLDKNTLSGLSWQNKKENIFRISWKHAAHNCFNRNRDSDLFERWAYHTGRHHEGNHKRWKANFRCALNSLPDVMELKELGVRKGDNAFKVYKFLDSPDPTMKEKMEIKRKYSLMAGLKLEESQSGSSTPTTSTAPSSPDKEGQTYADGGIQTLLKAIELKSQQQKGDKDSKTPQKRGSTGGATPGRSKRSRKAKEKEISESIEIETAPEVLETVVINSARPSPVSTPGSDSGAQNRLQVIDPKTGKTTFVQLRKTDTPTFSTDTGTSKSEIIIPVSKLFPISQNVITIPGSQQNLQTVTTLRQEQILTLPFATSPSIADSVMAERNVSIPLHLLQQELQKQQNIPGLLNLGALLSGNNTVAQIAKQLDPNCQTIPLTVLEQINQVNQARLLEAKQKIAHSGEKTLPKTFVQSEQPKMMTAVTSAENLPPVPQINRNITSIAAALRMSGPGTPQPTAAASQPVITTNLSAGLAQDPQGIRSKLVSRLMVSGSTMTNQNTNVRMSTQMPSPTSVPRPRLEQILVKPNPILTLPKTQLQPVRTTDMVIMTTASSSNTDVMSGSTIPKLIPGSERSLDLSSIRGQLTAPTLQTMSTSLYTRSREAEVATGASRSSVCTPELRPDILDKQITIELSKMESSMPKQMDETQHLSENYSNHRRTVQTQCNMFLWNYLNGKMEESGKDLFNVPVPMPPSRKTVWTQCSFNEKASLVNADQAQTGSFALESGELTRKKKIIQEALRILKLPQYRMLSYKVVSILKTKKKALHIFNKEYFSVLGHGINPVTLTVMSNGKVTLDVIFRPIEKFDVKNNESKGILIDKFKEILDKIITYSVCPGLKKTSKKIYGKNSGVTILKYPFRRYQSKNCRVWFHPDKTHTSMHLNQCQHCKQINGESLEPALSSLDPLTSQIQESLIILTNQIPGDSSALKERLAVKEGLTKTDDGLAKIVIKDVMSRGKKVIKEMEKVVVEKIECVDTVLECVSDIPP